MKIRVKYFDKDLYSGDSSLQRVGGKSDWVDLRSRVDLAMKRGDFAIIPLGVAIELPHGYEALLAPRSSTFKRWGVIQTNSVGVIDETYCGDNDEWGLPVFAMIDTEIHKGDRLCQFRLIEHQPAFEVEVVEKLNNADRNGFGSTGER